MPVTVNEKTMEMTDNVEIPKPKKDKKEKAYKPTLEDHEKFLNENSEHFLLKALNSSGNLKATKSGISMNSTPLSFYQNLISNIKDTGYKPRKLQLTLDGVVLFEQTI